MSDLFYEVVAVLSQWWNALLEAARTNPLVTLVLSALVIGILISVPLRHAWMYLRLWYWQALVWRDKMLGRYRNFGKRARAADDLVRLVTKWSIEGTIKKNHADHILRELAKAFSLNEIIPQKDVRPLHRFKVDKLKEAIKNGSTKLAGPIKPIPGGLPEPVTGKRKLRVVSG